MRPSTKKILLVLLLVVVAGALILPHVSFACSWGDIECGITSFIFGMVNAVNEFLGILIGLMTEGIRWIIEFGSQIMSLPVVRAGFEVSLNFINLLFVEGVFAVCATANATLSSMPASRPSIVSALLALRLFHFFFPFLNFGTLAILLQSLVVVKSELW